MESTTSLRPKLKQDSIFLPNNDGVLFRNGNNVFFLKGASVYQWVSSLAPHLTGEHTLEELCQPLDPGRREMVVRLVRTLVDKGMVKDHVLEDPATLPEDVRARFAPQIELIDHYTDNPVRRFKAFRQSRLLLVGSGAPLRALVGGLARNGLETLSLAPRDESGAGWRELEDEVAGLRRDGLDTPLSVERVEAARLSGELARFEAVAYCSDGASLREAFLLNEQCYKAGVKFLPGVIFNGLSLIGPFVRPGVAGCWQCALLRLSANLGGREAASLWKRVALGGDFTQEPLAAFGTTARMLGNSLAFELFKAQAGHQSPECEDGLLTQNLETLESSRGVLLAHPLCGVCGGGDADSERAALGAVAAGESDRALTAEDQLQAWYRFLHPRAGLFGSFSDEDAEQVPLRTTLLVVGHPAEPAAEPARVCAHSVESTAFARHRALLEAVKRYAHAAPDARRMVSSSYAELLDGGGEPVAHDALSVWSGLRTFDRGRTCEWLPAYSSSREDFRYVPAAAVYPDSPLNRDAAFESAAAGQAVGVTYAETLEAGLISALSFERLRDVLRGSARVASLDPALLGDDTDLGYLLKTLERFDSPVQLLELVGDIPVCVVLARSGATPAGEIVSVGSGFSRVEAARQALVGVVGTLQQHSADAAGQAAVLYPSEITFRRFSLPADVEVAPLERERYAGAGAGLEEVKRLLRGGGRDVLFVNTTPADIRSTETFITGTVLLTG
jgi:putative thiazole-containing bacteriocin maturation protein